MPSFARTTRMLPSIIVAAAVAACSVSFATVASAQVKNPEAAKIKNPVKPTPDSIAAGKTAYNK